MNPFKQDEEHIDLVDTPERRVLLECMKCGTMTYEAKYWPELKLVSWKCSGGHINKQEIDLSE